MSDAPPPPRTAAGLRPGDRLGPYEIRAVLGSGGLGTVYRALDERLGREVAVKVLAGRHDEFGASLADLEREARLLASVSHPGVLGIFDVGEDDGRRWVATELLDGVDLRRRMGGRPLPWRTAVAIVLEAAKGLAAAHSRGIVHLDLKPENIFVLRQGGVKLLDFGLARQMAEPSGDAVRAPAPSGRPVELAGTMAYVTPEQLCGGPVDHRTDIFSLGSVLYEVLCGRSPFQRDTPAATLDAIARADVPPVAAPGTTIPAALARVVRRCLRKNPGERFQTAYDLAFALSEQLAQPPAGAASRTGWPARIAWFAAGAVTTAALLLLLRILAS